MMRPIGKKQIEALSVFVLHDCIGSPGSKRVRESLVSRGLARDEGNGFIAPTAQGLRVVADAMDSGVMGKRPARPQLLIVRGTGHRKKQDHS